MLATARPAGDGSYSFGEFATQGDYVVRLDVPDSCAVEGSAEQTVSNRGNDNDPASRADFDVRAVVPQPVSGTVRDDDRAASGRCCGGRAGDPGDRDHGGRGDPRGTGLRARGRTDRDSTPTPTPTPSTTATASPTADPTDGPDASPTDDDGDGGGELPDTGGPIPWLVTLGGGVLVAGLALLSAGRRRGQHQ